MNIDNREQFNDHVDALLRDVNTPGDVRALVLSGYSLVRYLDTVEFYQDSDGVTHVRPAPEPDPNAAPAAVDTAPDAGTLGAQSETTLAPEGDSAVTPPGETPPPAEPPPPAGPVEPNVPGAAE